MSKWNFSPPFIERNGLCDEIAAFVHFVHLSKAAKNHFVQEEAALSLSGCFPRQLLTWTLVDFPIKHYENNPTVRVFWLCSTRQAAERLTLRGILQCT